MKNDYSAINANLINWWPFNNDLKDAITGKYLSNGVGYSFSTDRLSTPNSAIYFNNGYLQAPSGIYFYGDFTITAWVKARVMASASRVLDFGSCGGCDNVFMAYNPFYASIYPGNYDWY